MRSRMSKTYIDQLRGPSQTNINPPMDINNNENVNSSSLHKKNNVKQKAASSLSLPQVRFQKKLTSACQSAITLLDHRKLNSTDKSILSDINSDDGTEEIRTSKPSFKCNNQLTVPPICDYSIRISNTPSICDEQQETGLNDSRSSDALGYLHMYQNHNRIQFSALQFNDREDLQVKEKPKNFKK